CQQHHSRPLTF
nr:immunoglobulin light chain junction region [Macaca mulatta]MOV93290.1 immunoglobulin light chain junction region [Macaca mulatta]MOV93709.1 immunoglobulin light chain junction region [Macaca mulatta]